MKIFTIIGILATVVVIFALGYWYAVYQMSPTDSDTKEQATTTETTTSAADTTAAPEGSVQIETSSLTEGQRSMLNTLGIDADAVTITPTMVQCAKDAVGEERLAEIQSGVTPSFSEGVKLFACYSKG